MKLFYKFIQTFILLICNQLLFSKTLDTSKIVSVNVDIVALDESLKFKYPDVKMDEYFMVITLTNTQDTTVHLITMTCSWATSFLFNKDSFSISYPGCDSNFPNYLNILPHKSVKFFAKLRSYKKNHNYKNPTSFKLGFIDLPFDYFYKNNSKLNRKEYKTYWSEDIYLRSYLYGFKEEKY